MPQAEEIRRWLENDYSRFTKIKRGLSALYYNRVPRTLRFRPLRFMNWLMKAVLASSAPILAYAYGTIPAWMATVAALALFVVNTLIGLFDRITDTGAVDNQAETFVRVGDLVTAFKAGSVRAPNRTDAIRSCLGILENMALPITKSNKGDISVSLIVYVGNSSTKMRISDRNPGNTRPTNREIEGDKLLGHHCCAFDAAPRVIDDILSFGKELAKSPTQPNLAYRSIFVIPLEAQPADPRKAKGFISIDCARPYAFYGNRSNEIIITSEPLKTLISELI